MDKEFFLLFTVMDENLSWYLKENIKLYGTNESDPEDAGFQESNKMHGNLYTHLLKLHYKLHFYCENLNFKIKDINAG